MWLNAVDLQIAKADAFSNDVDIPLDAELSGDGYLALHAASDLPAGPLTQCSHQRSAEAIAGFLAGHEKDVQRFR